MDSPSSSSSRNWTLVILASIAFLTLAVGGWLSLRELSSAQPRATPDQKPPSEQSGDTASIKQPKAAVPGRLPPEKFGFPSYPTATDYRSMVIDKKQGSSAYLVKGGTSDQIVRFYIEKLGAAGWKYEWKREAAAKPKDQGTTLALQGTRVRWIRRTDGQQLTLLVLDDSQKGRTAQAVLSWSPLPKQLRRR